MDSLSTATEPNIPQIQSLLETVQRIQLNEDRIQKATGADFNLFDILRIGHYEVKTHSPFLAELLDPKGRHGQGSRFLELFLQSPVFSRRTGDSSEGLASIPIDSLPDPRSATVSQETSLGELGRVDITICDKRGRTLIIENKINAGDQEGQISRYLSDKRASVVVYLTLRGDPPSVHSFDLKAAGADALSTRLVCASYQGDILDWLQACRREVPTVPQVCYNLTQYIQLVSTLTGQNPNSRMNNEIVNTVLQSKNHLLAFDHLVKAEAEVRTEALLKIEEKLKDIEQVKAKGWTYLGDHLHSNKHAGFGFTHEKLQSIHPKLTVSFSFDGSNNRNLYHGFLDAGKAPPDIRHALFDAFKAHFDGAANNSYWIAWIWFEQYRHWTLETLWDIIHDDKFTHEITELLRRYEKVLDAYRTTHGGS